MLLLAAFFWNHKLSKGNNIWNTLIPTFFRLQKTILGCLSCKWWDTNGKSQTMFRFLDIHTIFSQIHETLMVTLGWLRGVPQAVTGPTEAGFRHYISVWYCMVIGKGVINSWSRGRWCCLLWAARLRNVMHCDASSFWNEIAFFMFFEYFSPKSISAPEQIHLCYLF